MTQDDDEFVVVRNDDGMYSVWWVDRPVPAGWTVLGTPATRAGTTVISTVEG